MPIKSKENHLAVEIKLNFIHVNVKTCKVILSTRLRSGEKARLDTHAWK